MCEKDEKKLIEGKIRRIYCGCTAEWESKLGIRLYHYKTGVGPICPKCQYYPWYLVKRTKECSK